MSSYYIEGENMDTLIYIDDSQKYDASVAANSFTQQDVKNRVYINTLGAELAMKYLLSENINISNIRNLHSIKKILEELDIADIMLPNIHIDVRVIFDENLIFIPKSHFEYNLVPDIYLVFELSKDRTHVKFPGFFEPKLINKNNANDKYYFIEKEKLTPALNLKEYIENFKGSKEETLSEEDFENSQRIILAMNDHDITEDEKKYLISQLTKSVELRDKCIEFENFETLSSMAFVNHEIVKPQIEEPLENIEDSFENFDGLQDEFPEFPELPELSEEEATEDIEDLSTENVMTDEPEDLLTLENVKEESIENTEESPETLSFEDIEPVDSAFIEEQSVETIDFDENIGENLENSEINEQPESIEPIETLSLDDIEPLDTTEEPLDEINPETFSFEALEQPATDIENLENISIPDENIDMEDDSVTLEDSESFGKNLLENLTMEEDVEIEPVNSHETVDEISDTEPAVEDIDDELPASIESLMANEEFSFEDTENATDNEVLPEIESSHEDIIEEEVIDQIDDILSLETSETPTEDVQENSEESFEQGELSMLFENSDSTESIDSKLEESQLSDSEIPGGALLRNDNKSANNKKVLIAAAAITVIAAASLFTFLKPKNETAENLEPITEENNVATNPMLTPQDSTIATNTPDIQATVPKTAQQTKELKSAATQAKTAGTESYITVNKIIWDVPDELSYSTKMQNYLRTAGKSIKLSLSADLLVATEYAYTNQVKLGLKLSKDGNVQDAKILAGSGSDQIDKIVLQCVKETLSVVKPPSGEVKTPDFNLNLIISF